MSPLDLTGVKCMPAVVCTACAWWCYEPPHDARNPRPAGSTPAECPDCRLHHGWRKPTHRVWIRFEERA